MSSSSSYILTFVAILFLSIAKQEATEVPAPNCDAYRNATFGCIAYVASTAKDMSVVPTTCCDDLKKYHSELRTADEKRSACVCSSTHLVNSPRVNKARVHKLSEECKFRFPKSASDCDKLK
ncbi:hypothetical protein LINGRAPRIM_LOCUS1083 [Linum grandiflorum]